MAQGGAFGVVRGLANPRSLRGRRAQPKHGRSGSGLLGEELGLRRAQYNRSITAPSMNGREGTASLGRDSRRITNELGMSLKINKIVSGTVELTDKECDKDNQRGNSRSEGRNLPPKGFGLRTARRSREQQGKRHNTYDGGAEQNSGLESEAPNDGSNGKIA